jgi:hypothetical protein cdivTM_05275
MKMIKVNVENVKGILVTTSNRVAEELGVRHDHLLNKIDGYIAKFNSPESSGQFDIMQKFIDKTDKFNSPETSGQFNLMDNFRNKTNKVSSAELSAQFYIPHNYKDISGKTNRNYLITQKGIAQLIGGYNASVPIAFALNVAYINEFERMRKELQGKRPMTRKMESIRNEITLDNKLTYHGTPILITRQLNKLVGYDISLKLSKVKGRSILRNEKVKELKKENAILSNQLTYTAIYYEKNLKELLQKIKELREFKDKITEYFISNEIETRLHQDSNNIEIALKLLDNITDTAVKERISIGILEKMGY